nr:hypothetical protein [Tanacetum cinerariifolium]
VAIFVGRDQPPGAEVEQEPPALQRELAAGAERIVEPQLEIGLRQFHGIDVVAADLGLAANVIAAAVDQLAADRERPGAIFDCDAG